MPQAVRKASELIDRVNALSQRHFYGQNGDQLASDFEIAKLKKDARILPNEVEKNLLLGMTATIELKSADVINFFEKALSFDPVNVLLINNFSISLDHLGLFEEAKKKAIQAYEHSAGDIEMVRMIISFSTKSGDFPTAIKWMETLRKLSSNEPHHDEEIIINMYHLLETKKIDFYQFQKLINVAMKIALDNKAVVSNTSISLIDETEDNWISYNVKLRASAPEVKKINDELIEAQIDLFNGQPLDSLVINFLSRE